MGEKRMERELLFTSKMRMISGLLESFLFRTTNLFQNNQVLPVDMMYVMQKKP